MKVSIYICAISILISTLFPFDIYSQDKRFVVISPRVGEVIDSIEAITYGLFQTIENFQSASFYRGADNNLGVLVKLKSADGVIRDSTFAIPSELLNDYIEWINHWDKLQGTDTLLLAPNSLGLRRPMFETIRFDVSMGLMQNYLSELAPITGSTSNIYVPMSFYIQIPLIENPSIYFIGGLGFALGGAGGGSVYSISSFLLYKPEDFFLLKPFVGFGVGYTSYNYGGSGSIFDVGVDFGPHGLLIDASESYPIFIL